MEVWATSMGLGILGISAVESRSFQSKIQDSDLYSQVLDLTMLLVHEFYVTRGSFGFNPELMFLYETLLCHRGWAIVTQPFMAVLKSIHNHLHDSHPVLLSQILRSLQQCTH